MACYNENQKKSIAVGVKNITKIGSVAFAVDQPFKRLVLRGGWSRTKWADDVR